MGTKGRGHESKVKVFETDEVTHRQTRHQDTDGTVTSLISCTFSLGSVR